MKTEHRIALVAGASGLVGGHLLRNLLEEETVATVHVVGRRPLPFSHPKLQMHVTPLPTVAALSAVDEVYLSLGTTIKVAGSQAAFRAVDFDANFAVARAAHAAGARRIGLVSALGANAQSSVFYNRVKGELEVALQALDLDTLVIARPSLLLGDRRALGQPARPAERLATWFLSPLRWLVPPTYRPVQAARVARALLACVPAFSGVRILSSAELQRF